MEEGYLDYALVPSGLLVLVLYHGWLMITIVRSPQRTIIGINNVSRRRWIYHIMNDPERYGILAVQSIRNNLMASTVLASIAITLSSVISAVVTSASSLTQPFSSSPLNYTINQSKYFSLLLCFLTAFFCNMQCTRYYAHVSLLVNAPSPEEREVFIDYVAQKLIRGGFFWSLGLRAFYFAFPLLLWTFGPIPMFVGSCFLAFVLYFLDTTSSYSKFDEVLATADVRNHDVDSIGSIDTVHSGDSIVYFSLPGKEGEGSTSNTNFLSYAI